MQQSLGCFHCKMNSNPPHVFSVDSDDQTCDSEQDRDKKSRPLISDVGENPVKSSRAGKPRAPPETSSHGEVSL